MKNKKYGYYKNRNTGEYEIMQNKTKRAKFSEKRTFLTPWYVQVRTGIFSANIINKQSMANIISKQLMFKLP